MLSTGYISFVSETGGGFDGNGNPTTATKVSTSFTPCNILVVTKEYRLFADGQAQQAKFSVYIDYYQIYTFDLSALTEVTLHDSKLNNLGTYQVQNKEYLDLSKRLKIVV